MAPIQNSHSSYNLELPWCWCIYRHERHCIVKFPRNKPCKKLHLSCYYCIISTKHKTRNDRLNVLLWRISYSSYSTKIKYCTKMSWQYITKKYCPYLYTSFERIKTECFFLTVYGYVSKLLQKFLWRWCRISCKK